MKKPTQKNQQTSKISTNLQLRKINKPWNLQPRKIIKPRNLQPRKSPQTQKIIKLTWKNQTQKFKTNQHPQGKTNPGQRESDLIGSFPHSLSSQTHKKNHHLFQFRNPLPDSIYNPHASTWRRSSDAMTLVSCDGGDARADLLRVLWRAWRHEENPQGIHELDHEEQGGFLGRSKKECYFIWPWVFWFGAWCLLPWVSGFGVEGWSGANQREKWRMREFKG